MPALNVLFLCSSSDFAHSLVSERAQEWGAALYNQKSVLCNDYAQFVAELRKTFVPPSSKVNADGQLLHLH